MAKASSAAAVKRFTDIPNIGRAMAGDFALMGMVPGDIARSNPFELYRKLCVLTKTRQDPCVLDTFMAAVDFMRGGEAKPWWHFTPQRRALHPEL
jgi:hypothetical protein